MKKLITMVVVLAMLTAISTSAFAATPTATLIVLAAPNLNVVSKTLLVNPAPVSLGTAGNYAILAKSGISSVPDSVITGNIAVSPIASTAITGFSLTLDSTGVFSTSTQVIGKVYAANYASPTPSNLTTAVSNMETAYTDAAGRAANYTELYAGDISSKTLTSGVYKWGTGVLINSDVTLSGGANDVFVFQVAQGITQASNTKIILSGGAQANNIFWQAAQTVSIGTGAHFEGIILGKKNITLGANASINGRLLAQTAVTLIMNTVVEPSVSPAPPVPVAPSKPANPQGLRIDPTTVRVTWDASTPGTNPIAKYRIYRSLTNLFSGSVQKAEITNLASLRWDDTDANLRSNYYYWITALDSASPPNKSARSEVISILNKPRIPILVVHGWQALKPFTIDNNQRGPGYYDPRIAMEDIVSKLYPKINYPIDLENSLVPLTVTDTNYLFSPYDDKEDFSETWQIWKVKDNGTALPPVYISNYNRVDITKLKEKYHPTKRSIFDYSVSLFEEINKILENEPGATQVDIVAHSMGGLVARAYIENNDFKILSGNQFGNQKSLCAENDTQVRTLITIGTPHHSMVNAFALEDSTAVHILSRIVPLTYQSTSMMLPANTAYKFTNFLSILNYGLADYNRHDDEPYDILNPNVHYITIGGIFPNESNMEEIRKEIKKDNPDPAIYLHENILSRNLNSETTDLYNDGFIHSSSARLYPGPSMVDKVEYYPIVFTSHKNLIENPITVQLVKDLIDGNQYTQTELRNNYWGHTLSDYIYWRITNIASPVSLSVIDQYGNKTGITENGVEESIPGSFYSILDEKVAVLQPGYYSTQITGQGSGTYGLFSSTIVNGQQINLINQPAIHTNTGSVHLYTPDWLTINLGLPFTVNIQKDEVGDGVFEVNIHTPYSVNSLTGSVDHDVINLNWSKATQGTYPIKGYKIYRSLDNNSFTFLGYTATNSYTDMTGLVGKSYYYNLATYDDQDNSASSSNIILVGPLQEIPKPNLALSIVTNKMDFCTGEDVLYKVTIFNNGNGSATDTVLKVTFPREIEYRKADKFKGEVQSSGLVVFYLVTIPSHSSVTFQINAAVLSSIPFEKSTPTFFEVGCKEGSIDQKTINLTLKRCGGGSPVQDILVYYKNVHTDPATGEIYLLQTEELEMDVTFSGFTTPLSYEISWGDGAIDKMDKQIETKYLMKHKFTSKGKMVIKIKVSDSSGRSKMVSLNLLIQADDQK